MFKEAIYVSTSEEPDVLRIKLNRDMFYSKNNPQIAADERMRRML